jgi:hypothetical protein
MITSPHSPGQSRRAGLVPCRRVAPDRWRTRRRTRERQALHAQRKAAAAIGAGPAQMETLAIGLELQWLGLAALERRLDAHGAALAGMQGQIDALLRRVAALEADRPAM